MDKGQIISNFKDLSKIDKINLIQRLLGELKEMHNVLPDEVLKQNEILIPSGIFQNDKLSCLEAIIKYLRENFGMKLSKIGRHLNRSNKAIWATYRNASIKMPQRFGVVPK